MKNKLSDLNDILFEQLERITDDDLDEDKLQHEIQRTTSVVTLADRIVDMARLQLEAAKAIANAGGGGRLNVPSTLALPSGTPAAAPTGANG